MWCVEDVFGNHSSTSQIDLHGNPYTCDCHMMPLLDWIKSTRARLVNKVALITTNPVTQQNNTIRAVDPAVLLIGDLDQDAFFMRTRIRL